KALFRAPEYRKVVLLTFTPADAVEGAEVTDADVRKYYDDNPSRYRSAERRKIRRLVFLIADQAKAAAERIKGGVPFTTVAKERGQKGDEFGYVTNEPGKSGLDKAVIDAAFALPEGGVSAPLEGPLGTTLIQVVQIEPGVLKPFDEVAPQIKREMSQRRTATERTRIHNEVEDQRGSGLRLEEIAQKLKLPVRTIEAVDRSGRDPEGKPIGGLPSGFDI